MVEGKAVVVNDTGLHTRPAVQFVTLAKRFSDSDITLINGDKTGNAKSMTKILSLGLSKGTEFTIRVEGGDEAAVLKELQEFVSQLRE